MTEDPANTPPPNKLDLRLEDYSKVLRSLQAEDVDDELLRAAALKLGPSIYKPDAETVSASDANELQRFQTSLIKHLDVTEDEAEAATHAAINIYGASHKTKLRAVMLYLAARHLGKRAALIPDEGSGSANETGSTSATPPTLIEPAPGTTTTPSDASGSGGGTILEGETQMNTPGLITFLDALKAERTAERRLRDDLKSLSTANKGSSKRPLTADERDKLLLLEIVLDDAVQSELGFALDDTYLAMRERLWSLMCNDNKVPRMKNGHFGSTLGLDDMDADELVTAAVWGRLRGEGTVVPTLLDAEGGLVKRGDVADAKRSAIFIAIDKIPDPLKEKLAEKFGSDAVAGAVAYAVKLAQPTANFAQTLTAAFARFNSHARLYEAVLRVMAQAPDVNARGEILAREWVVVTDALIARGVGADNPALPTLIRAAIDDRLSPSRDKVTATAQIVLPDLEQNTAQQVQKVNLEAAQAIYFAAMMDEAHLFDVVDKLAELFQIGALPLEKGNAGEKLYQYIRKTPERISPYERRNTYARVFGTATGDPNAPGAHFRAFDDLWLRFVSAVSDWYRKNQVENLFASNGRYVPSQEQVRKTGLDLAANLSLYCYGGTWFVASELQKDISTYVDLLSSPEIRSLYGARDMWQVIDQVSVLEFGRPVNTIRARTMANAGAIIIGWLEKKSDAISQPGAVLVDPDAIRNPSRRSTSNSINDPSDYDLVTACEQWLAIEGVGSDIVDVKAEASPSAITSTSPVRVPPAAQDILGAFGFSHDAGSPNNTTNGAKVH